MIVIIIIFSVRCSPRTEELRKKKNKKLTESNRWEIWFPILIMSCLPQGWRYHVKGAWPEDFEVLIKIMQIKTIDSKDLGNELVYVNFKFIIHS